EEHRGAVEHDVLESAGADRQGRACVREGIARRDAGTAQAGVRQVELRVEELEIATGSLELSAKRRTGLARMQEVAVQLAKASLEGFVVRCLVGGQRRSGVDLALHEHVLERLRAHTLGDAE